VKTIYLTDLIAFYLRLRI